MDCPNDGYRRQSSTSSNSNKKDRPPLVRRTSSFEAHQATLLKLTTNLPVKHLDLFSPDYDAMMDDEKADFFSSLHEILPQLPCSSDNGDVDEPFARGSGSFQLLQIGMGSGATLRHYPRHADITVIDPNPKLMEEFSRNPPGSLFPTNVKDVLHVPTLHQEENRKRGSISSLHQLETGSFDVAVAALVLCSTPDPDELLLEIRRVLKPGGLFYFWEHCESPKTSGKSRLVQQAVQNSLIWPALSGGCRVDLRPWEHAIFAGFSQVHYTVFSLKDRLQVISGDGRTKRRKNGGSSRRMNFVYSKVFSSLYKYHTKGIAVN